MTASDLLCRPLYTVNYTLKKKKATEAMISVVSVNAVCESFVHT